MLGFVVQDWSYNSHWKVGVVRDGCKKNSRSHDKGSSGWKAMISIHQKKKRKKVQEW